MLILTYLIDFDYPLWKATCSLEKKPFSLDGNKPLEGRESISSFYILSGLTSCEKFGQFWLMDFHVGAGGGE